MRVSVAWCIGLLAYDLLLQWLDAAVHVSWCLRCSNFIEVTEAFFCMKFDIYKEKQWTLRLPAFWIRSRLEWKMNKYCSAWLTNGFDKMDDSLYEIMSLTEMWYQEQQ